MFLRAGVAEMTQIVPWRGRQLRCQSVGQFCHWECPPSFEIAETRWPGEQRKTSIQFGGSTVPYVTPCPLFPPRTDIGAAQITALGQ
jgi:hypothetical protein